MSPEPLFVSIPEAARLMGIGRTLAYEMVHASEIPTVAFHGRLCVPVWWIKAQAGVEPRHFEGSFQ